MRKFKTAIYLLKTNPKGIATAVFCNFSKLKISHMISDRLYLKMQYRTCMKKKLDLSNPKSFNEKLQWLKLYDRRADYVRMVDKCDVKNYVADVIGEEYIIPTLAIWDRVENIDMDGLPSQFVLKCTHDSGSTIICKEKNTFDIHSAKKKLRDKQNKNLFWHGREWPYKNVPRKIIAEQYMQDSATGELRDYKFMCFNGEVKCSFVCSDRFSEQGLHVTFFDRNWRRMPFARSYPVAEYEIQKPENYEKMIELAEKLSKGIPFVRVDFYEVDGKIYFGELTFFPGNGMEAFQPEEWDYKLGEWITLPNSQK